MHLPRISRVGAFGRVMAALALVVAHGLAAEPPMSQALARLEAQHGGRLGVSVAGEAGGAPFAFRGGERFAFCSTFKVLLTGAVLARVDEGQLKLDQRVAYSRADLLAYAPVTRAHAQEGALTVGALCAAAVEESDNTAANLLLRLIGGPGSLTAFARSLGDAAFRLDRPEPGLNENRPGDPRDTTTPDAMAATLSSLISGPALSRASRARLEGWLMSCRTGASRLRAGLPAAWRVGDKTGTGGRGATHDVAVVRRPGLPALFIAAYYEGSGESPKDRERVLAEVGRIIARQVNGLPLGGAP